VEGEPREIKDVLAHQRRRRRGGRNAVHQIEMERQRLGRELHTGVGQMLSAIRLQLEVISAELPSPPNTVGQALSRISILAADTLDQVVDLDARARIVANRICATLAPAA